MEKLTIFQINSVKQKKKNKSKNSHFRVHKNTIQQKIQIQRKKRLLRLTWITAQHFGTFRNASNWFNLRMLFSWLPKSDNSTLVNLYGILPPKHVLLRIFSHLVGRTHRMIKRSLRSSCHGLLLMSLVILLRKSRPLIGTKSKYSSSGLSLNGAIVALKSAITMCFQNSWMINI